MTGLQAALLEMAAALNELHFDYMLIGGLAVGLWGEPRGTLDVDLTLWVEPEQFESTLEMLAARYQLRNPRAVETARRSRVLAVRASNGIAVDLLFAAWPLEKQALGRAVVREVSGVKVRVAPIDYLLFLKLISDRPKDLTDAEVLLRRHRNSVDLGWLRRQLASLAESTAQPDILNRFERLLNQD